MKPKTYPDTVAGLTQYIRNTVQRPKVLPEAMYLGEGICLRFGRPLFGEPFCPMGLLKEAKCGTPYYSYEFRDDFQFGLKTIKKFADWWDDQKDPQKAVDAVWGKEKK